MLTRPIGMRPDEESVSLGSGYKTSYDLFAGVHHTHGIVLHYETSEYDTSEKLGGESLKTSHIWCLSGYIEVCQGVKYSINWGTEPWVSSPRTEVIAWYDSSKKYIGYTPKKNMGNFSQIITPPKEGEYIKNGNSIGKDTNGKEVVVFSEDAKYMRLFMYSDNENGISIYEIGDGALNFSFNIPNGDIEMIDEYSCWATLFLLIDNIQYKISFTSNKNKSYAPHLTKKDSGYQGELNIPLGDNSLEVECVEEDGLKSKTLFPLSSILKTGSPYSWKIRLYERDSMNPVDTKYVPNIKVGYGTLVNDTSNEFKLLQTKSGSEIYTGIRLDTFPFQNIYDDVADITSTSFTYSVLNSDVKKTLYNMYKNYDDNVKYWIVLDGNIILINYRLYPYAYTDKNNSPSAMDKINNNFDSYGNPLYGYILFLTNNFKDFYGELSDSTDLISLYNKLLGKSFEIRTNYIDSKWAYFEVYDDANITIKDNKNHMLSPDKSYDIDFCNLELSINYSQPQGVSLNYFSYKVYSYSKKDDEYVLDYSSPNYYGGNTISYDNFFNDKEYKFVVTLVDVNQRIYTKTYLFHTVFKVVNPNQCVTATYYAPHHSIIVDWSKVNSINPTKKLNISDYQYVEKDTNSNKKSLYIPSGSALYYSENDFHVPLNFNNASLMFDFYGTNKTGCDTSHPEILSFSTTDGFNATVSYEDCSCIVVKTNKYTSKFIYLYEDSDIEMLSKALLSDDPVSAPFVWNEGLSWNDDYSWKEDNRIANKWRVIITPTECRVIPLSSSVSIAEAETSTEQYGSSSSSYITLHGEVYYDRIMILEDYQLPEDETTLKGNELYEWTVNTNILSDFDSTVDLASLGMDFQKISKVRVFKQIGSSEKLYEVANTDNSDNTRILEDFAVGDNCEYRYYIYPIIETNVDGRILQSVSNAMVTNSVIMNGNADNVLGLRKIGDNIYEVDPDEVWVMRLNLEDNGYTLNTDKNFYDTLNKYNQEIVGNRKYITKQLTGMIGYIDCKSRGGFSDNYDLLTSWNDFASGASLKCLVDVRGLILPGNFEANPSIEYLQAPTSPAVANFTWRQKSDLDIIKIYGTFIPFNYADGYMLSDSGNNLLTDNISELLYTEKVR